MDVMEPLAGITRAPNRMGGKPCLRGLRVTVGMIVGQIGAGRTVDEVLADYPYLEREDIWSASSGSSQPSHKVAYRSHAGHAAHAARVAAV